MKKTVGFSKTISNADAHAFGVYDKTSDIARLVKNPFNRRKEEALKKIRPLIREHVATLAFKYRQSKNHLYGKELLDTNKWDSAKLEFAKIALSGDFSSDAVKSYFSDISKEIDKFTIAAEKSIEQDIAKMSPFDFEDHCANVLRSVGWLASATKCSGDQGVDVIAKKKKLIVAVQCKLYSGAVGNKAVQEALAGREFASATFGAVVTNAAYTRSAYQLASSAGILLLHLNDLADLESRILKSIAANSEMSNLRS